MSPLQLLSGFRQKKIPLALRASAFVILVCISIIGIEVAQAIHTYQIQFNQVQASASNLSRSVGQHVFDTFKGTDVILDSVVDTIEKARAQNQSLRSFREFLVRRAESLSQIDGLFIYDEDGHWLINSSTSDPVHLNNADRDYFQHHKHHNDTDLYIGPPIQSKLTGEWILTVSKRLNHRDGSFAGVALATIRMKYFQDFYAQLNTGKDGAIIVARKDGIVLMRKPFDQSILGKNISGNTLFKTFLNHSDAGIGTFRSFIDGVTRINSYKTVDQYPLVISAALSREEAFAEWKKDTLFRSAGAAILIVIIGAIGYRMAKQILLRTIAEDKLREAHLALEEANAALRQLVKQDALTGLASRREFDVTLHREFSRAMRLQQPISLIMIDVDFFKQYNDTYGHPAGDECLKSIAVAIAAVRKRPTDLTARYGGEEMVVLLPDTPLEGALQIAEKIRAAVFEKSIPHQKSAMEVVTISAGVTCFVPQQNQHVPGDLVLRADEALYRAKDTGRNRVCSMKAAKPVSQLVAA